jgi:hypothetical protein
MFDETLIEIQRVKLLLRTQVVINAPTKGYFD